MQPQRPKRRLLRYHDLPTPVDHIYIHSALNRIGKMLCPESWGIGPAWEQRAFRIEILKSGGQRLIRFKLDRANNRFKRLSQNISKGDSARLKASSTLSAAMLKLLGAIQSGTIKAYHMTIDDKLERIPPNSMHWIKRRMQILHTGYVFADRGDGKRDFVEVLLCRSDFERWLSKGSSEEETSSKFTVLSDELIEAWLTVLRQASAQHGGLRFSEERLWRLIKEDLRPGIQIQRATFEKKIFQQLPESARQTVGAARKRDREKFDEIRAQLASELKETSSRMQRAHVAE